MLIPVCGGVVVGMLHGVIGIIDNIHPVSSGRPLQLELSLRLDDQLNGLV
jgi:hypothetical protein